MLTLLGGGPAGCYAAGARIDRAAARDSGCRRARETSQAATIAQRPAAHVEDLQVVTATRLKNRNIERPEEPERVGRATPGLPAADTQYWRLAGAAL